MCASLAHCAMDSLPLYLFIFSKQFKFHPFPFDALAKTNGPIIENQVVLSVQEA